MIQQFFDNPTYTGFSLWKPKGNKYQLNLKRGRGSFECYSFNTLEEVRAYFIERFVDDDGLV